ncbi:ParB/RepB/Spo0J family partition protein [Streptosporangium lutulentum]|uniref:ParB/RepB/Spo0J family partition protein n=1 Tax=Streptosporangium lutulentum TaxID=1461250 RepID=A0ABT9QPF5_9ACTN|nr:ParB/RepB/Spo0J family partition protein [Streptosporangium lutulentum]MDP9848648.1 ParB/RepB/Spo0J family partition protein [Streptosporangium lutulentum]
MGLEVVRTGAEISLGEIQASRQKVRKKTGDLGISDLLNSMKRHGQIHAVSLLKNDDGTYELINGHRRHTAALKGGIPTLRANIYSIPPDEEEERELLIQQHLYAANMAEPLIDLERGYMFKAVKEDFGLDDSGVAACFEGETEDSVRKALSLLEIDEHALQVVQAYPDKFDEATLRVLAEYASPEKRAWRLKPGEQVRVAEMVARQENKLAAVDARELEKEIRGVVKTRRNEAHAKSQEEKGAKQTKPHNRLIGSDEAAVKALFKRIEQLELAVRELHSKGVHEITEIRLADKRDATDRLYEAASQVESFINTKLAPLPTMRKEP